MANSNLPKGLVLLGGSAKQRSVTRYVPSTDQTPLGIGDAVKSGGSADAATGLPTVTRAAAGDAIRGVVMGFDAVKEVAVGSENFNRTHRPASTAMYALVCEELDAEYEIQEDNSATFAVTMVGENADLATVTDCNTSTGYSTSQLSTTSHVTTIAQLRILEISSKPDNAVSANCKLRVKINKHELSSGTLGVGV